MDGVATRSLEFTYAQGRPPSEVAAEDLLDDPVEMTNLRERHTGVPGVIFISTRQGQHGPRVKWYPQRAGAADPFLTITLEEPARVLNHGVNPRDASAAVAAVQWVDMNREALLRLWSQGMVWDVDELAEFYRSLEKLD